MKFVADHMLGSLATWLRFLGFDVLYPEELDDAKLVKIASENGRILLTRDKSLGSKQNVFIIKSVFLDKQLEQVVNDLNLEISAPLSRCAVCNARITEEKKDNVKNLVPERVYKDHNEFWKCLGCGKIYWHGSHWKKIIKKIESLKEKK